MQDIRLPGMVHGRVVRPPRYGSKLDSVDEAAAKAMPGVVAVVRDGSFLGVVAEREEQAIKARDALLESAKWTLGPELPDPARIFDVIKSLPSKDATIGVKQGPAPAGARTARGGLHQAVHGACLDRAVLRGRRVQGRQADGVDPFAGRLSVARRAGQGAENAGERHPLRARRKAPAATATTAPTTSRSTPRCWPARCPGRPVRLQWMRDDEFKWEPYGPAMVMRAKAAIADGRIADWEYELWSNTHSTRPGSTTGTNVLAAWYLAEPQRMGPPTSPPQPAGGGDRNAIPLYDFPSQRVINHFVQDMPIRVSALRTLGAYANVFALESFMDELAAAAGADPVAFRLAHMKDPRARAVIEAVARKAGWKEGEKGDGTRGRGIGFAKYKNLACYVAWSRRSRSIARAAWCACRAPGPRSIPA